MTRLIDADTLKEHKFVGNKFVQIGRRANGKTLESINKAYQQGWNDCIDAIIDNAPTVCGNNPKWCKSCVSKGKCASTRTQGDLITEEQAIDKLHETGWLPLHDKEMTERPQGEWITFSTNHSIIQCSECTALLNNLRADIFKDKIGKMNFCPNCGAKMQKGGAKE